MRTKYHKIDIPLCSTDGLVLVVDDVPKFSELDESFYSEMMAHTTFFAHTNAKKVLLLGGIEGGVAREMLRHPEVESVTLVEQDTEAMAAAQRALPKITSVFTSGDKRFSHVA